MAKSSKRSSNGTSSTHDDIIERNQDTDTDASALTPYQQVNFLVYFILLSVTFVILSRAYGGSLTDLMRWYFPKEAATLGYPPLT